MVRSRASNRAANRWAARIVPLFLVGAFGIATYAVAVRFCVQYFYRERGDTGVAAALLSLYFLFFLATSTYARVVFTVQIDPGAVPLSRGGGKEEEDEEAVMGNGRPKQRRRNGGGDLEVPPWVPPDLSSDSPGLEAFYSKYVFVCEADGRPKWCGACQQWKPDRAHHSSELGRCVRKMDHMCPWVGGMVSETSFNFFQFTAYAACFCIVCFATSVRCLRLQNEENRPVDGWVVSVIVFTALFGFLSFAMALTSAKFTLTNTNNIDLLKKRQVHRLAIRIPSDSPTPATFPVAVYPLQTGVPARPARYDRLNDDVAAAAPARDRHAVRRFTLVCTNPGENPWDLGYWRNWKAVMGEHVWEWILPIRQSPCCNHESSHSDYPLGPLLDELRGRFGLGPPVPAEHARREMAMHR